jgi:hypothetical protein
VVACDVYALAAALWVCPLFILFKKHGRCLCGCLLGNVLDLICLSISPCVYKLHCVMQFRHGDNGCMLGPQWHIHNAGVVVCAGSNAASGIGAWPCCLMLVCCEPVVQALPVVRVKHADCMAAAYSSIDTFITCVCNL